MWKGLPVRIVVIMVLTMMLLSGCASQATFGDAITEGEPTSIPTPIVPSKPVYQVERGKIVYERRFFGRITPVVTEEIAFEIDGRIQETFVERGVDVSEGDVLAHLNTAALESQLARRRRRIGNCPIHFPKRR